MNLIHNERTKLLATGLNNTGVATVVTAFVAPIAAFFYGSPNAAANALWPLIGLAWLLVGLCLNALHTPCLGDFENDEPSDLSAGGAIRAIGDRRRNHLLVDRSRRSWSSSS
jgi:hypothetical protein